jgi:hypothetical protein
MFDQEKEGGMSDWHDHMGHMFCCSKKHKKEFKLAMLEKKEKMLQAKLDFIRRIKTMVEKSDESEDAE